MKTIFHFLFVLSFLNGVYLQTHAAVQNADKKYRAFRESDVQILNKFKNTHELANMALKHTPSASLREEIKKILKDPAQPLPPFRLRGNSLELKIDNQTYLITHVRGSQFNFNGKMLDLENENWYKKILNEKTETSALWNQFVIPQAHAGIPLIIGAIVIFGIVACIGSAALDGLKKSLAAATSKINPDNVYENPKELNDGLQEAELVVCGTFSCCVNAGTVVNKADYASFLKETCKASPQTYDKRKEELFTKYKFDENNKYFITNFMEDNPDYMSACRVRALNQSVIDYGDKLQKKDAIVK